MKRGAAVVGLMDATLNFLKSHPESILLKILDTHSHAVSGFLQHAGGKNPLFAPIGKVLIGFMEEEFMTFLKGFGGQKILVLHTCGPAVTNLVHFKTIRDLVEG